MVKKFLLFTVPNPEENQQYADQLEKELAEKYPQWWVKAGKISAL